MPGTTPTFGFRYQLGADPPDGDDLGKNLAEDVEARILAERLNGICDLVQQTAQTGWATTVATPITFGAGSETADSGTYHDTGSNTSRVVIGKTLGWWLVSGVYVPNNVTTSTAARAYIAKNGTAVPGTFAGILYSGTTTAVGIATPTRLIQATVATDYIELVGQQILASGTGGSVIADPARSSVTAVWVRPS